MAARDSQPLKVVLQYDCTPRLQAQLDTLRRDWLQVDWVAETDKTTFTRLMQDADVLWHVLEPVTAEVIRTAPRLRLIQKIGVGVNTIDRVAARAQRVTVANMPGTNSQAVAEHTLTLMLAVLRRAIPLDRLTRAGHGWSFDRQLLDQVGELHGRSVGFVGFGAVPQRLAPVCEALGCRVAYTATKPKAELRWPYLSLDDLLQCSDIVSLHAPLVPATTQLINREALRKMKPGAILINTARGGLVDESALLEALTTGRLAGAGLDVFSTEPVDSANGLLRLDNVVVAPHVAWMTPETLERSLGVAVENCRRLCTSEPLLHEVP